MRVRADASPAFAVIAAVIPLFSRCYSRCSVAVFEALNYEKMLVDPKHYENADAFLSRKQRMPAPVELKSRLCPRVGVLVPSGRFADLAQTPFMRMPKPGSPHSAVRRLSTAE